MKNEVSDAELKTVIADFLEMGHVENIISMFQKDHRYYSWTADLIVDERFNVRLGVAILFEELKKLPEEKTHLAIPSLKSLLNHESSLIRGETVGILGVINTPEAVYLINNLSNDPSPQVREMVELSTSQG